MMSLNVKTISDVNAWIYWLGVCERRGRMQCADPLSYFLTWVLRSIHFSLEGWEEADHFVQSASTMRVSGIRWRTS